MPTHDYSEALNNLLGGDWYYDLVSGKYEDFMTDRVMSPEEAKTHTEKKN